MKLRATVVGILVLFLGVSAATAQRKYINKPRPSDLKALPFSDGVLMSNTLFIAGQIGLDPKTGAPPASPEDEAKLVMESVKQTVELAGLTMDDIVSVQVFCTDLKYYETFNNVYFHGDYPARAFIGAASLLRNGKYEVMGIAVKKPQQ